MSDVLGRRVAYRRTLLRDLASGMAARGASPQAVHDVTEMSIAQDEGIYDADWAAATPTATDFRTWLQDAFRSEDAVVSRAPRA